MIDIIIVNQPNVNLYKTFASIAIQSVIKNINVIFIDSLEYKNSLEVIDKFSKIINIQHVLVDNCSNINKCRNEALRISNGEYITFVKPGDLIHDALVINYMVRKAVVFEEVIGKIIDKDTKEIIEKDDRTIYGRLYQKRFWDKNNIMFDEESTETNDLSFNKYIETIKHIPVKFDDIAYVGKIEE